MRKITICFVLALMTAFSAAGQAQIFTKKYRIADFTSKVMKVVLTGGEYEDALLREEVMRRWTLSPYEFCTQEEFAALCSDDNYYFLAIVAGQFRKETAPGLDMITVLKGGAASLNDMFEVVSLPFASAEEASGREALYFGPIIDVIQSQIRRAMASDVRGYLGIPQTIRIDRNTKYKTIIFADTDLSPDVTQVQRRKYFDENILVMDEDAVDDIFAAGTRPRTLVSYVVAPASPENGSYCYKMLFDVESRELVYYRRHKIGSSTPVGFLSEDIKRIVAPR